MLISNNFSAQDSIPLAADFTEDKELAFQEYFFEALSQKAIGKYQQAIENLESCHQIIPNDVAVFFEFSKNYYQLNNTILAREYLQRALQKDSDNIWMLKHLVAIFVKERNFTEAIKAQKKVVEIDTKERVNLIRLFIQNNDTKNAISLMDVLEKEQVLPSNYKRYKASLKNRTKSETPVNTQNNTDLESLKKQFTATKSYSLLKTILENPSNTLEQLLLYSSEGMILFPAQPFVYLSHAKALHANKQYTKAIETLNNGLDFVIETTVEITFYKELMINHKKMGNKKEVEKLKLKLQKLKK
ncbi:tetratricopeptide repeat protein [Polaribacter tangerinus]|uniref:tetratricopeptide repeat protein n=1 Tax=Polaribacter tangerinus TaxID=1920034 RepID=UPI0011811A8F|nr:hypothetical protein [Polaribacter tangerinus]